MKTHIVCFALVLSCMGASSQSTTSAHIPGNNRHLGWDDTGNAPLWVNQNNFQRLRLNSVNWLGLNGAGSGGAGNSASRITLGLNGETNLAWSMLHLWDGFLPATMQRTWFNIGTSYTGNQDFMYTGLLERPNSSGAPGADLATDAVVAWGCQDSQNGANVDNFRILFLRSVTANPNNAATTQQGLEVLRITPWGNVGLGDFSSMTWNGGAGLNQQPTHRLDVAGRVRIRQVNPLQVPATERDCILVGDDQALPSDYEVKRINFTEDPDEYLGGDGMWHVIDPGIGADCDWEDSTYGIFTGDPNQSSCNTDNVGIGTEAYENTKFRVIYSPAITTPGVPLAGHFNLGLAGNNYDPLSAIALGVVLNSGPTENSRFGIRTIIHNGNPAIAGYFDANANYPASLGDQAVGIIGIGQGAKQNNIGVYGKSYRSDCSVGPTNI